MTSNNDSTHSGAKPESPRKLITAAGIGNFVEWYDFAIYGFVAVIISDQFFPSADPTASLLATFAVFAISFFMRPVGGLIFGAIGDKIGRRGTLSITIMMMAAATTLIGLLPSYATIGVFAPILLIVARCIQGIAAGGEYAGAASFVVEHSPMSRRGFISSFLSCTTFFAFAAGALLTSLLTAVLGDDAFASWGWRLAFLLSAPLGLIGLYLRLRIEETPAFLLVKERQQTAQAPISEAVQTQGGRMVTACVFFFAAVVMSYLLVGYVPTYLVNTLELDAETARFSNAAAIVVLVILFPLFGLLSDRVGRKPVMLLACVLLIVATVPGFLLIREGSFGLVLLGQCLLVLPIAAANPMNTLIMTELFPTRVRYTSAAISYNVANMLVGGTAPFVATLLVSQTGSNLAPGYYAVALGVLSLLAALRLPETFKTSMTQEDPVPTRPLASAAVGARGG